MDIKRPVQVSNLQPLLTNLQQRRDRTMYPAD